MGMAFGFMCLGNEDWTMLIRVWFVEADGVQSLFFEICTY